MIQDDMDSGYWNACKEYLRKENVKKNKSKAILCKQTLKLIERNRSVFFDGYFNF